MKISTDGYHGYDNDFITTDDQVTNDVNKFRNHPSIIMRKKKKKNDQSFYIGRVTYDDVLKKVKTLDTERTSQQSDIPTKNLKRNSDYFAEYFYENINQCISKLIFPSDLKLTEVYINLVYKKKSKTPEITIGQLAYYPIFLKFTKDVSMIKFSSFSILCCLNINAGFVEATTHNTP